MDTKSKISFSQLTECAASCQTSWPIQATNVIRLLDAVRDLMWPGATIGELFLRFGLLVQDHPVKFATGFAAVAVSLLLAFWLKRKKARHIELERFRQSVEAQETAKEARGRMLYFEAVTASAGRSIVIIYGLRPRTHTHLGGNRIQALLVSPRSQQAIRITKISGVTGLSTKVQDVGAESSKVVYRRRA